MEDTNSKFMPTSCRFTSQQMDYIDSLKKQGESRSAFISRLIKERMDGIENLEKVVSSVSSKAISSEVKDALSEVLKSSMLEMSSSILGLLKLVLENSKNTSSQILELQKSVDSLKSELKEVKDKLNLFEVSE